MRIRLMVGFLFALAPSLFGQTVGIITQVKGKVSLAGAGAGTAKAPRPAMLADTLTAGVEVSTAADGSVTFLFCPKSSSVTMGPNSRAVLSAGDMKTTGSVTSAAVKYCFVPPAAVTRASKESVGGVTFRAGNDNLRILSPALNARVLPAPTFSWTAVSDVDKYLVNVQTRDQRPVWNTTAKTNSVEFRAGNPLAPGEAYRLRVMAMKGDEEIASASMIFRVLPAAEAQAYSEKLQYFREQARKPAAGAGPHLQLGMIHEELGDPAAAARAYEEAARFGASDVLKSRIEALRR